MENILYFDNSNKDLTSNNIEILFSCSLSRIVGFRYIIYNFKEFNDVILIGVIKDGSDKIYNLKYFDKIGVSNNTKDGLQLLMYRLISYLNIGFEK